MNNWAKCDGFSPHCTILMGQRLRDRECEFVSNCKYGTVKSKKAFVSEEWGGKSWMKIRELRKPLSGFGCKLIQNHKGDPEENAHLERPHRTDDEEFYIPRVLKIKSEKDLLDEALGYIYYYNNVREHSSLNYQTPYQYLRKQLPDVDSSIRFVIPIMLDKVSVQIGRWSGYNVLAQYLKLLNYSIEYRVKKEKEKIEKRYLILPE